MAPTDPTPERPPASRWRRLLDGRVVWGVLFLIGIIYFALRQPVRAGDGLEYWATLQAWFDHGSPDVRPADLDELARQAEADGVARGAGARNLALAPTAAGKYNTHHFWMYPLLALPAKLVLRLCGGDELAAL